MPRENETGPLLNGSRITILHNHIDLDDEKHWI